MAANAGIDMVNATLQQGCWYRVHSSDTVAVALKDVPAGVSLAPFAPQQVESAIPFGHKVALVPMKVGDPVVKYGAVIGRALADIAVGDHVHTHNLATALTGDFQYDDGASGDAACGAGPAIKAAQFQGYRRANGTVGTRNEIWILPTVGCVNTVASRVAALAQAKYEGVVDGIHAFPHPYGCSQLGDDLAGTRQLLQGLAKNPNAGGVLVLGLGCENNQLAALVADLDDSTGRLKYLGVQEAGDEFEEASALVDALVAEAAGDTRTACSLQDLSIGLKCGGSDAFSGLTANPLLGCVTNSVTQAGGQAILTEIPEMFGAEAVLLPRAANSEVCEKLIQQFKAFRAYFESHGQPVFENPSPGNKAGGITTLEEKSLGAVQKAGQATITDVLPYGVQASVKGLSIIEAPGNDAVSSTALAAAGATLILFTTGRGTPLGFPVPTVKVSSNTALAEKKKHWIDYDAGQFLAEGGISDAGITDFLTYLCAVASGQRTCNEQNDAREIAIWKRGVTL